MSLLERAEVKFPEGTNGPKVAPKDGAPADLTNELIVNAKEALKLHWAKRRYDKMQPKQQHAALGYNEARPGGGAWLHGSQRPQQAATLSGRSPRDW